MRTTFTALILAALLVVSACSGQQSEGYHPMKSVPVAGEGGWDLVTVDSDARRVYVAHSSKVDVLNADNGEIIGAVQPLDGAHGVAIVKATGHGFATSGKSDSVKIFDLKTLALTGEIKTGKKPDFILFDSKTKHLFVFNADGDSATVIDAVHEKAIATIKLGGAPEFAVADGKGHVFVNLEDKSQMLGLNTRSLKVEKRWNLSPCVEPASLSIDRQNNRLFAGCSNNVLAVIDAKNGKVITTLPIGDHVDSNAFDGRTHEIISSASDGTMTVIAQDDADHYHVAQTVTTPLRSRTLGLDESTHRIFVPSASFGPTPAPSAENPKGRPQVLPGTFNVQIFSR